MPTLDVIVPCYNYSRFLKRCVKSALNQESVDVRVLIIDDCSSDDTPLVGERLAREYSRVEFRRHDRNQGHIATYNEGLLGWAKADYSLLLSADDAMAPGAAQRAHRLFETSPDVGLVYGMGRVITHDDEFQYPPGSDFTISQIILGADFISHCCELCYNPVPTPTAIVRTAWQHRLGGYRSDLPHTGDVEMWMRFALNGSVGVIGAVQGEYRWHGGNMGLKYYAQLLGDRREFALACQEILSPILASNFNAHLWLDSMHRRLFSQAQKYAVQAFDCGDMAGYKVWLTFARELSGHLERSQWPWRLAVRQLLGNNLWRALNVARRALARGTPNPQPRKIWSPSHADINGWWPEPASKV